MHTISVNTPSLVSVSGGSPELYTISEIIGWIYVLAWSISYYPQIYENWKRKSVIGYSFDLLALETIDMTLYTIYNIGLLSSDTIQDEYKHKHYTDVIPVEINDLVFGVHAVFCCLILILQCSFYERGGQGISKTSKVLIGSIFLFIICTTVSTLANAMEWIDLMSYFSYVKIATSIKYVPQAYMNFKRKSTDGFSIGLVLLDLIGAGFSIGQMIVNSVKDSDWTNFSGNPTKFGVAALSIIFDIVFIFQHYVCFKKVDSPLLLNNTVEDEEYKEEV